VIAIPDPHAAWLAVAPLAAVLAAAIVRLQPEDFVDDDADGSGYTRTVAIALCDGVELLDFAGPGEVFQVAGAIAADRGRRALRVTTVGPRPGPVRSQGFLRVIPDHGPADAPDPAVLVVPGGGIAELLSDRTMLAWIRRSAERAEVALSVCTGAFALASAGQLDGRSATTWHGLLDRFRDAFPSVRVVEGRRFVDEGPVVTTAGVSAGIDGALHVVARLLGARVAERTAAYMEYRWSPEAEWLARYPGPNPATDDLGRAVQDAEDLDRAGRAEDAAELLAGVVARESDHGPALVLRARALLRAGRIEAAREASDRAVARGFARTVAVYDRACILARAGDLDGAVRDLRLLKDEGLFDAGAARADDDLATVRGDARAAGWFD